MDNIEMQGSASFAWALIFLSSQVIGFLTGCYIVWSL